MTDGALDALQGLAQAVLEGRLEEAASLYLTPVPIYMGPRLDTLMTPAEIVTRLGDYHTAFRLAGVRSVEGRLAVPSVQRGAQVRHVVDWRYRLGDGTDDLVTRMAFYCTTETKKCLRIQMVEYLTPTAVSGLGYALRRAAV